MSLLKKLRNKKLQKAVLSSVLVLSLGFSLNDRVYAGYQAGDNASAGSNDVAIGENATADWITVAIGKNSYAYDRATTIGAYASADDRSIALGYKASASDIGAIAIGTESVAQTWGVAIGYNSSAIEHGVAFGGSAKAVDGGTAIGYCSNSADRGTALGSSANAGDRGTALGYGTNAAGSYSTVVGYGANSLNDYAVAIGYNSSASANNSVAIGYWSVATEADTISFGSDDIKRRLVNVAAGTAQTDAANVSQLISSGSYDNDTKKLTLSSNSGNDVIVDLSALSGDNPDVDEPVDLSKNDKTARVVDGFNTKVVANKVTEDKENNLEITEYQVNVEGNGAAEEGNTGLISGDTLYNELKDKADITYIDAELANKADTDLGNITDDGKGVIGNIAEEALADDLNAKANADASNVADHTAEWGAAIGTGVVEDGNGELVTGGTVYNAVKGKADITYVDNELLTKADVDLSNITEGGQTVIQNIAKGSIKLENGTNTTVSSTENADGSISYQVNVEGNGKAEAGNTGLINGDTLYNTINENITNVTEGINAELDGKANADASNVADHTAEWGEAIGTGKVETGNGELVTGDTVYNAVKDKADTDLGNLTEEGKDFIGDIAQEALQDDLDGKANIDASNIETDKWADKLGTGTITAGDTNLVTGDTVYDAIKDLGSNSLVTSDGNTISVGKNDSATVIDISKHNGDGSTENRVITGIETDANDMSSAANVGYVNQSVGQLATDLNRGLSELDSRMKKGVAGAAALAALNPLDYDPENKLNFAAGVGSYKGESATALGMFYRPNENVMFSLGASIGNGENMWNAGITFNLDKPSASTSKAAMARAIKTMAAENDALEAKTAEQDAKIALLTEQVEALLATQEK